MASAGFEFYDEIHDPRECKISGEIPKWLNGVLYRSGPGQFSVKDEKTGIEKQFSHWFDGLQRIHRFEINGSAQKALYSCRGNAQEAGKMFVEQPNAMIYWGDQEDPCQSKFGRFFQMFKLAVGQANMPANVNVVPTVRFPGKPDDLVITTDFNILDVLDKKTLKSKGVIKYTDINPALTGGNAASHHCIDPDTGEYYDYLQEMGPSQDFTPILFSKDAPQGKALAKIRGAPLSYLHSFSLTKKYVVYVFQPWQLPTGLMVPIKGRLSTAYKWYPDQSTLFYVYERASGEHVATYTSKAFFFFHSINAYDSEDDIVIDLCGYDSPQVNTDMHLKNLKQAEFDFAPSSLHRFKLRQVSQAMEQSKSSKKPSEKPAEMEVIPLSYGWDLPRVHPNRLTKPYQYFYASAHPHGRRTGLFDRIIKVDAQAVKPGSEEGVAYWKPEAGGAPAEPVFVPAPGGKAEDDGVLLTAVLDPTKKESYLAIIDARSMKEISRAWLGTVMAYNFHGEFEQ